VANFSTILQVYFIAKARKAVVTTLSEHASLLHILTIILKDYRKQYVTTEIHQLL
jgi:hypothetical protein